MVTSSNESGQGGTKRQRIDPPLPVVTVNDLSADLWCSIADFLPKTPRALLAVALTAPPASFRKSGWKGQPNALSKAIISAAKTVVLSDTVLGELYEEARVEAASGIERGSKKHGGTDEYALSFSFRDDLSKQIRRYYNSEWEVMDFVDIPVSLASRLSDNDVGAVLVCIDAKNNLRRLKLTHCFNVVGTGLGPLRGSTVIQYLDLEFVREFEEPWHRNEGCEIKFDEIMLSEVPVLEVLDTILGEEGNSLIRVQYPYKWYDNVSEVGEIKSFPYEISRTEIFNEFVSDHNAVVNKFSCCLYFGSVHEEDIISLLKVNSPEDVANLCVECGGTSSYSTCSHCNEIICCECCKTIHCSDCNVRYCPSCCADHESVEEKVTLCGVWCEPYCSTCRLDSCKNGNNCDGCREVTFDALFEECNTMQSKLDAQRKEIEVLNRESTNAEVGQFGDNISSNNHQIANGKVEDETGLEPDIAQPCSRCNRMIWLQADYYLSCSGCDARYCLPCNDGFRIGVTFCNTCDGREGYCIECRLKRRSCGKNDCKDCKRVTFDALLAKYSMKQAQVESHREEIERMR